MATHRALKDVYLGNQGFHKKDEEFDYVGPENHNLEPLKKSKADQEDDDDTTYHAMKRDELKAELVKRDIDFAANAADKTLRRLLEENDEAKVAGK